MILLWIDDKSLWHASCREIKKRNRDISITVETDGREIRRYKQPNRRKLSNNLPQNGRGYTIKRKESFYLQALT
ncbi:hypothetical protein AV530_015479 [Patagioenas fasciata monilis]|uniref:Uncharacterized protein n=1 Tax=Patagioenas fasciata monilis TaxID=372326 RepID=A0A1V4KRQ7_PATFA|nr:hypothetical protein AV530_015479 [Patagioenas fasciata monilis]